MVSRSSRTSLIIQEKALKAAFPESEVKRYREKSLVWLGSVNPSPLSGTYKLKLFYERNKKVKVFVVDPKPLALAEGQSKLPHVYSTAEQHLCLFYPYGAEWNADMLYAKTIIPWACEWLCHYEIWACTGTWHGGGVEHGEEIK